MTPFTRKSVRRSKLFQSRFRDGGGTDFPVRQYLRCREDFFSGLVHSVLLLVFFVTLVLFTRTINKLFLVHGQNVHDLYRFMALGLMALFSLLILRRLLYKVRDLRETRREMCDLQTRFREDLELPE